MDLFAFVLRGGSGGGTSVASGHGRALRRKADFAAPRNALGSIKNDDEHEQRESAVAQSGRRGETLSADRKADLGLRNSFGQQPI